MKSLLVVTLLSALLNALLSPSATPLGHAGAAVFVGPSGGIGNVLVLDDQGRESWPTLLQGIVLLPFDLQGRTRLDELQPDRPRLACDVPGAVRVRLPRGQGCLYRYRRDETSGAASFGYFVVERDGSARSVLELPGTGACGADDPVATRVAVSPKGDAFLIATSLAAGGDLIECDLEHGRATNRTARLAPLRFREQGLVRLSKWGVALTDAGPLRFDDDPAAEAEPVPPATSWPAWFGNEVVTSADETTTAIVGGGDPIRAFVYVFGRNDAARRVTDTAAPLSDGGFLPEAQDGPTLALSTDGSHVAWRTEGPEREAWVRRIDAAGGAPDVQITRAANFEDTLNDTGVIAFHGPDRLTLLVGGDDGEGLEEADFFRVCIDASGTLAITDLSRTNERAEPPFGYGRITLADGIFRLPGAPAWLVRDPGAALGEGELLWIDEQRADPVALLTQSGPLAEIRAEDDQLFALVRGSSDTLPTRFLRFDVEDLELYTWPIAPQADLVRFATEKKALAAVLVKPDGERLGRLEEDSDPGVLLSSDPCLFGPTLAFSDGVLFATVQVGGRWSVLSWSGSGAATLQTDLDEGFLLPGD